MSAAGYNDEDSGTLEELAALCDRRIAASEVPFAARIQKNVPIYDMPALAGVLADPSRRRVLMAEWAYVLGQASGTLVLLQAQPDHAAIDRATEIFNQIIAAEAEGGAKADHFAAAGANSRIWNVLEKHCRADPENFARYYGAPAIEAASEAWLGPAFQMTAQVNVVRPGGQAQVAHRDYHLGFQTAAGAAAYPAHVHALSPALTLQGAIAHCDMPVESGPTKLLPFSQLFQAGYMAYRRPEVAAYFEDHWVQLPLSKGDALFFNPALLHGAGANTSTDIQRMANLLQVSSAFGRAMEAIDRRAMCKLLYPVLQGRALDAQAQAAIACTAEGYAFPSNLDTDPPRGGLAPESMAQLFHRALQDGMNTADFNAALDAQAARQRGER